MSCLETFSCDLSPKLCPETEEGEVGVGKMLSWPLFEGKGLGEGFMTTVLWTTRGVLILVGGTPASQGDSTCLLLPNLLFTLEITGEAPSVIGCLSVSTGTMLEDDRCLSILRTPEPMVSRDVPW